MIGWLAAGVAAFRAPAAQLNLSAFGVVTQSTDLSVSTPASRAIDGSSNTISATRNEPGGYWYWEAPRVIPLTRVEMIAPTPSGFSNMTGGLTLRVEDLHDRAVFTCAVTNPGAGGTWGVDLPPATRGRIVRFLLENGRTNDHGSFYVMLAEVRVFGDATPDIGPLSIPTLGVVTQSTTAANPATLAVDGNPFTYSLTTNAPGDYWLLTLDQARPLHRIELVNRHDASAARLSGLTVRVLDDATNSLASAVATNGGLGASWGFTLPPGTTGRMVRIGLEGGVSNGAGDRIVQLAEVNVLSSSNLALNREAYMVRLQDTLPSPTNANDGNYATETYTTTATVDGYWETDLGQPFNLQRVRAVCGNGFAYRVSHCTVRLFDANHDSVWAQHVATNTTGTFDTDIPTLPAVRYVRIGLENKERTHITGGIEWYLNFREVMAYGRPVDPDPLPAFAASPSNVAAGGTALLTWQHTDLWRLNLYPGLGSAGSSTTVSGAGAWLVAPTATTEYVLLGSNQNGAVTRAVTVTVSNRPAPPRLSEFMADNRITLEDGYGDPSDWIEIHNPNATALDLAGCGLSDDPLNPMKWVFPPTNIPPHGHVIVFASGRGNPVDDDGRLHASFQLAADGESIVLTASNGTDILDQLLSYPEQGEDLAYGRTLDGVWTFLEPTPDAFNHATTYTGWLKQVVFSHERGFYTNGFSLTLSNRHPGATLNYSINGPEPATAYAAPINVASSLTVRAQVVLPGYRSSRIKSVSFLFLHQVATAAYMNASIVNNALYTNRLRQGFLDLPILSVNVPVLPDDYVERPGSVELFMPGWSNVVQADCGVLRFGGAWTTFDKKNYRLEFRRRYGDPQLRVPLFAGFDHGFQARDSFDALDLLGGSHDMSQRGFYMSGRFVEDTMLDLGSLNPHGRFVHLFLNGTYWGQYNAREQLVDTFLAGYLGGDTTNYVTVRGNDNVGSPFVPGTPEPPRRYPWTRARDLRTNYLQDRLYVDVPNLTDFLLTWWYGSSENEYRGAGSVDAGSGFKFWIADADGFLRATTADNTGNAGPGDIFGGLVSEGHVDFKTLVADRIEKHFFRDGGLTPAANRSRLDARMAEITNSLVAECARWTYTTGRTPDNWESAANTVRNGMFLQRTTNLLGHLRNRGLYPALAPPVFSQYGGSVTSGYPLVLSSATGTIYYTLDGSDPRLPGGAVSPLALATNLASWSPIVSGGNWRYWDQGSRPATNWAALAYTDAAWPTGRTEFGYGDSPDTVISYGPSNNNKYVTSYFRTPLVIPNAAVVTQLVFGLLRDDGAAVYLNGQELFRSNLPTGTLAYATFASAAVGGTDESTFFPYTILPTNLVSGTNVLAVEVHQSAVNSSDLSFNLTLDIQVSSPPLNLPILSNTTVRARVLQGTNWSALVEVSFVLATIKPAAGGEVVISEIHYEPSDDDDYQFIELHNAGTNLANLGGARLAGGVDFLFPAGTYLAPGQCLLVVENALAFSNRYRTASSPWYYPGLTVAGEWAGKLSENGEAVSLLATNLADLCSVTYATGGRWPERAAGGGSSLELRNPAAVPADAPTRTALLAEGPSWRSSALNHGSPGRLDDYTRPAVISEALSHTDLDTDWVELHNPNASTSTLSGLWLGDSYANALRYQLTNGTSLPPDGRLVLSSTQLGFGFSELGSDILLTQASGTNMIRFVDTVDVTAMEREESAGRYTRSDGETDFTELRALTKGGSNALPRVGPVVFSEIMYKPATGLAEYVELVNLSGAPIPFHDPLHPTNRWSLSGAVDYLFPTGFVLEPCRPLLVCSTSPAAFRAQYGVATNVVVLGPWSGVLDNAGESIKLHRPGDPELDNSVPQYRVDRVNYLPGLPWPAAADGGGVSLERVTHEAYGNDPAAWQASAPGGSPGTLAGNRLPFISVNGDLLVNEGSPLELTIYASDDDLPWQTFTLSVTSLPAGSTFTLTNGVFAWTPGEADGPAAHLLPFRATDTAPCGCAVRTQDIVITVAEINQPPAVPPLPDLVIPAAVSVRRQVAASDPDLPPQALAFAQSGLPAGLALHPSNGWIEGAAEFPGVYGVSVLVSDDQAPPLSVTGWLTAIVTAPFVFHTAEIAGGSGGALTFETMTNASYEVQYSDSLSPPAWQFLHQVTNAPGGPVTIHDPVAPDQTQRLYRVLWLDTGAP